MQLRAIRSGGCSSAMSTDPNLITHREIDRGWKIRRGTLRPLDGNPAGAQKVGTISQRSDHKSRYQRPARLPRGDLSRDLSASQPVQHPQELEFDRWLRSWR